jgi:hypothetical protein
VHRVSSQRHTTTPSWGLTQAVGLTPQAVYLLHPAHEVHPIVQTLQFLMFFLAAHVICNAWNCTTYKQHVNAAIYCICASVDNDTVMLMVERADDICMSAPDWAVLTDPLEYGVCSRSWVLADVCLHNAHGSQAAIDSRLTVRYLVKTRLLT